MKKSLNKKAQQSNWFMIILILAIITLVVVALALTGAFDHINHLFSTVSDLETAVQACEQYASLNLVTSYCNNFQKVDLNGRVEYVTCDYLDDKVTISGSDKMTCPNTGIGSNKAQEYCKNKNLGKGDFVNGEECSKTA